MQNRSEDINPRQQGSDSSYNPTARNFDQTDVFGEPEKMSGNTGQSAREEESEDTDPSPTEINLNALEDDQKEREGQGAEEGQGVGRAREQKGPVK